MKHKLLNKLLTLTLLILVGALFSPVWAQTVAVDDVLWTEPFKGSNTSNNFSETTSWGNYITPTTFVSSDASKLGYSSSNAMLSSTTSTNMTGAHVWLNKSVNSYIQVTGIPLYNATKVKISWSQATSGSSTTVYYQFDGTGDFTSLSTCSGPNTKFESAELSVANHSTIALKFHHPNNINKNTRIDNLTLKVTEIAANTPSISADDVEIAYNATNGSIGYSLTNGNGNVSASVTSGDWLELGEITESAVPFICSANTGAERSAEVTLSYQGAENKVVTVTQTAVPTHTFTYFAQNGSISGVVYGTSTAVASGASVAEGGKITLTATPASGYTFSNWSVEGTGSSLTSSSTNPTTFTMGTADATVTANFTATGGTTTYSVTYDGNGATSGSVPTDATAYSPNATVTVLGNTGSLAKTGYAFDGWNTLADGSGTDRAAGSTFNITENTTLYAKWNPYTITAQSNNNTYGTVTLSNFVITGSPAPGYRYADPAYSVTSGSASVAQEGDEFTVTPTSDCTVRINFEAIPTHTATFSVNGNTTAQNFVEGASIIFPSDPADISEKKFVGWTNSTISGTTDNAPSFVTSATMSTSDVTFYAVFADVTGITEESWTETEISSISSSDVIVISNGTYAMNNDGGASNAPTTNSITVTGTSLSTAPNNNLKWNVSGNSTDGYTFYPNGTTETWLYCNTTATSSSNNNIRVGTGDRKVWGFNDQGYLVTKDTYTTRYLSIYSSQDFRGYVNTTNGAFVPKFYKHIAATATYANYCTSVVVAYSVTYDGNGATSGSVPTDATAYSPNATVTVLGNTGSLAKTGFAFGGWNTQADGEGTNYAADATFNITGNTTLYAKWNTKTITGLSYTGTPTKTTYYAGDSFDPAGLTVNASYNDESQEDVTASVLWTPDPLTKGTTSVTGTYMGQTVNITGLTVKEAAGAISITADNPVNVVALGGSGDLALAYENLTISSASDFGIQFYDANDDEIEVPTWIEVTVENVEPSSYKVSYVVLANNVNSARSAYFKVYALDNNSDLAYSNKVTITQAAIPDFVADGVFDFVNAGQADYDYGSGVEKTNNSSTYVTEPKTWTSGNVTMVTAQVSGYGYRWWSNDNTLRFYNESTATFSVPDGYAITKIVTTGANFDSADKGELLSDTWTGLSKEVKLTATAGRNVKTITVTYVPIETVTVGTTGYATYASDHALDFTGKEIKAYIAKAKDDGTGVTFERVYKIPAGTGVLLYKDGGAEEEIPVTTESTDDVSDNVFVRGEGVAVASEDDNKRNYILNIVNNVVGFYKAAGNKVAKNRAYIQVKSASLAKDFISMPGFDDSTTGVTEVNGSGLMVNGPVYDLQGRRVEKPGKGLYIVNGKKVLKY